MTVAAIESLLRNHETAKRQYDAAVELLRQHLQFLIEKLYQRGMSYRQIGVAIGISASQVNKWANRPELEGNCCEMRLLEMIPKLDFLVKEKGFAGNPDILPADGISN